MMNTVDFSNRVFNILNEEEFNRMAIELYNYQKEHVSVYKKFLSLIGSKSVSHYSEIPCLPVSLFKNHIITDQQKQPDFFFSSSGTTGQTRSRHFVSDLSVYERSFMICFQHFYGHPSKYTILALLPSYIEQGSSSLVYMAEHLISQSGKHSSGFYLRNYDDLSNQIKNLRKEKEPLLLLGVTYALLDFIEQHPINLSGAVIMETGGMKGRRKEMIRDEIHRIIIEKTGVEKVHSEYGMTELLSQAYSAGDGLFKCPPWMKVLIRDAHDPFSNADKQKIGGIHIIDLANIHSCAFIETQDLGRSVNQDQFEVLGRVDHSELRGCNLMVV